MSDELAYGIFFLIMGICLLWLTNKSRKNDKPWIGFHWLDVKGFAGAIAAIPAGLYLIIHHLIILLRK
jgi:hypothetical protein